MALSAEQRRQAHRAGLSTDIATSYQFDLAQVENAPLRSRLTNLTGGLLAISGTAYWVYVGQTDRDIVAAYIRFFVSVVAAGDTRAQELALATSVSGPDRAAKTLTTKAVATTTGDYTAATGSYANSTSFAYNVPAGTHLWLGVRFAMSGTPTQPTVAALGLDTGKGEILSTTGQSALAANTSYTGSIITQSATLTTAMAPDLVLVTG